MNSGPLNSGQLGPGTVGPSLPLGEEANLIEVVLSASMPTAILMEAISGQDRLTTYSEHMSNTDNYYPATMLQEEETPTDASFHAPLSQLSCAFRH
jgi:hypothetical protein